MLHINNLMAQVADLRQRVQFCKDLIIHIFITINYLHK